MTIGDWISSYAFEVAKWLNTAIYLIGLGIAVRVFFRCRKRAYLVVALYFAIVLFAWHVWPPISHSIYVHRTPLVEQEKANADFEEAVKEVLAREGHPIPAPYRINIQIAPIVLVFGLWLLARREPKYHQPNPVPSH